MNYSFLPFSPLAAKPIMAKFGSQQYQWQLWSNFTHNSRSSRLVEMKIESGLWCWYAWQRITNTGNFASNWKSQEKKKKNLNVSNKIQWLTALFITTPHVQCGEATAFHLQPACSTAIVVKQHAAVTGRNESQTEEPGREQKISVTW